MRRATSVHTVKACRENVFPVFFRRSRSKWREEKRREEKLLLDSNPLSSPAANVIRSKRLLNKKVLPESAPLDVLRVRRCTLDPLFLFFVITSIVNGVSGSNHRFRSNIHGLNRRRRSVPPAATIITSLCPGGLKKYFSLPHTSSSRILSLFSVNINTHHLTH